MCIFGEIQYSRQRRGVYAGESSIQGHVYVYMWGNTVFKVMYMCICGEIQYSRHVYVYMQEIQYSRPCICVYAGNKVIKAMYMFICGEIQNSGPVYVYMRGNTRCKPSSM